MVFCNAPLYHSCVSEDTFGYAIGDERFRERTEEGVLGVRLHKADDGDIVWPEAKGVAVETITAVVAERFGIGQAGSATSQQASGCGESSGD